MRAEDGGGPHGTDRLDGGAEPCRVDLVHPRAIDRRPQQLKIANLISDRAYVAGYGKLGRRQRCPKAVRAEQRPGPLVQEASGARVVEQRRSEGAQPTIADVEGLSWVEKKDPVEGNCPLSGT